MQKPTLSVGDAIETRCTKCRQNTKHLIISMSVSELEPEKVQCNPCEHKHKYKLPVVRETLAEKAITKNKEAVRRKNDAERKEWEDLCPSLDRAKVKDYSMNSTYKVKAVIKHPVFGLGQIQRVIGSQKMEVLFEDGKKMMRCK